MATVVNTPATTDQGSNVFGMILTLVVVLVAFYLFFIYGLPAMRQPAAPQIQVPDKIDVNVDQGK